MRISVVVPAFNEAEGVQNFLSELRTELDLTNFSYEVVIVNDGSSDSTREKILEFSWDEIRLINLTSNSGHMAALEAGLKAAKGELVITMDSDLQHPPRLIHEMIKIQKDTLCDAVICVRTRGKDASRMRNFLSKSFYSFLSRITKFEIQKDAADFRLMTRSVVTILNSLPETSKVYRFLISALGFEVKHLRYTSAKREFGESKYSGKHLWRLAMSSVIGFSTFPLSAIFISGMIVLVLSSLYLCYIVIDYAKFGGVPGWTSVMSATLLLSSFQIMSLGIIGRYLSQILNEVRQRPNYIVKSEE